MGITHLIVGGTYVPESPIERYLLEGLSNFSRWMGANGVTVSMQERIGPYRADFVLRMEGAGPLVVECDGAQFHSGQQQVQGDEARDRYMAQNGFRVLRIAGADLWRYPTLCARHALLRLSWGSVTIEENEGGDLRQRQEDLEEDARLARRRGERPDEGRDERDQEEG